MAVGDVLADDRGIEARSVVGDRQHDAVALRFSPTVTVVGRACLPMLVSSSRAARYSKRLRLRLTHVVELGLDGQIGARLELPQQFSHRRGEAELGQHLRDAARVTVERNPVAVSCNAA